MGEMNQTFDLLDKGNEPERFVEHKAHTKKFRFLAAVAKPR